MEPHIQAAEFSKDLIGVVMGVQTMVDLKKDLEVFSLTFVGFQENRFQSDHRKRPKYISTGNIQSLQQISVDWYFVTFLPVFVYSILQFLKS